MRRLLVAPVSLGLRLAFASSIIDEEKSGGGTALALLPAPLAVTSEVMYVLSTVLENGVACRERVAGAVVILCAGDVIGAVVWLASGRGASRWLRVDERGMAFFGVLVHSTSKASIFIVVSVLVLLVSSC